MLPEKQQRSENKKDEDQINVVKIGDKFLREQLSNTTQALKGATNRNNKLNREVKRLRKQRMLTSIGSILFLLIGLTWFTYTTYLYMGKQQEINMPVANKLSPGNDYNLISPLLKVRKEKAHKQYTAKPKKIITHQAKRPSKKERFTANKLIKGVISQNTRNSKTSVNSIQFHTPIDFTIKEAIVVAFTRKDSAKHNQPLTLIIRSNDPFEKPIHKRKLTDFESIVLYRKDFSAGLYYLELRDKAKLVYTKEFTIQLPAQQHKTSPKER
ncbi:hypothetical protein [uncultured Microscilla sp.]|uniref:hypothetical protein n=1 Tax=uncultured Microscilla sp. TaxID=432653 RepID=UPI0026277FFD|nr:hypothetical protein [uncultured Microscilla sp.]